MKKMQRMISLVLAIVFAVCLFSGCEKKVSTGESGKHFTYWKALEAEVATKLSSSKEVLMYQELEKITGVSIDFMHPPSGEEDTQFNLMVASGDLPDMIEYRWSSAYPGGAQKAIDDSVIIKLNDLLPKYAPNLYKFLQENPEYDKQCKTDDGSYFALPSLNVDEYRAFGGMMLRKDWLDELNLSVPETLADWENVLKKFRDEKGATAPFTGSADKVTSTSTFSGAFMTKNSFYIKDNKVVYGPMEPEFKEYLETINRWYKEGLIDKEILTNNADAVDSKVTSGKSGAFFGFIGGTMGKYLSVMKDRDPKFDIVAAPYPVLKAGDEPYFIEAEETAAHVQLAITTKCENPELALQWADYLYSQEGYMLKQFGVEGVTYNMVDGYPKYTDLILNNPDGLDISTAMALYIRPGSAPGFNQDVRYLEQRYAFPQQVDALEKWNKNLANRDKVWFLNAMTPLSEEADEYRNIMAEVTTYCDEMISKFIIGTEPMSNYDDFVSRLEKLNIDRAIEINQGAFERYNSR